MRALIIICNYNLIFIFKKNFFSKSHCKCTRLFIRICSICIYSWFGYRSFFVFQRLSCAAASGRRAVMFTRHERRAAATWFYFFPSIDSKSRTMFVFELRRLFCVDKLPPSPPQSARHSILACAVGGDDGEKGSCGDRRM